MSPEISFSALKSKRKRRYWIGVRTIFNVKTTKQLNRRSRCVQIFLVTVLTFFLPDWGMRSDFYLNKMYYSVFKNQNAPTPSELLVALHGN